MQGLTPRCAELLSYLKAYSRAPGTRHVMPSHEEMAVALGLRSKSGVNRILRELEERGHLRRAYKRARAIELVSTNPTHCPHCGNYLGVKHTPAITYSSSHTTP